MTERPFGIRKRRNEGRWLLAGFLMVTTGLVVIPKAEAAGAIFDPWHVPADTNIQRITALSADGTIYLARLSLGGGSEAGLRGSQAGATIIEGPGNNTFAYGMSGDGRFVVGSGRLDADNPSYARAFRWDAATGDMIDLGLLYENIPLANLNAYSVSGDGSRVVGRYARTGMTRGFVWIEGAETGEVGNRAMYRLNGLDDANHWIARAISDDGNFVVGESDGNASTALAVRWDITNLEAGGTGSDIILNLGSLTGVDSGRSNATGVSADGRVVVGTSRNDDNLDRAFRWVEDSTGGSEQNVQMYDLGTINPSYADGWSAARAVSRDGNYVVGDSQVADDLTLAFRWSEETGMESVEDWLARFGVQTAAGWNLTEAAAISDDGRVVAGHMQGGEYDSRAYIARVTGEPGGGGLMDVEEYHQTLYSAAGIANAGDFLSWLPMNGAHHRPLMLTPNLEGDMCAWATGDFAHHGPSSTGLALAEMGACTDLAGGNVRIGGSVGTTTSWQDLALGGAARMQGQYVLSEVDWQPDGTPLLLSLTGMIGSYQANISRAYSNGAATALSSGDTRAMAGVVRLRGDWLNAAEIGDTTINPYASLSFGALHVDGYSESGGPFPAVFNAQNLTHADIRVGVTAVREFSTQTRLSATIEVAHRTGTAASASGHVPGLFNFALGGGTYSQTWARVGAELDHKINDGLALSTSVHLASNGRDPSLAASVGLKGVF